MASRSGYITRFNPVECVMKAQAAIVAEPSVVGMTTDSLVLVRKLKTNTFHTVVRVKLRPEADNASLKTPLTRSNCRRGALFSTTPARVAETF